MVIHFSFFVHHGTVFFSPVNLKSARERCFFENFHGHFLAFTGTFSGKFTRKCMPSRALFWPFSRALFMVHGHQLWRNFTGTFRGSRVLFPKKIKNVGFYVFLRAFHRFTGTFPKFTGTFC